MINRDERIVKIDIFPITGAPQQIIRDSLEAKRSIQDGSVNGNNADSRRSFNITDVTSSGSNKGKNEEVVENIHPNEDDNIDEIHIILGNQDDDAGDSDELILLSSKGTYLEEI